MGKRWERVGGGRRRRRSHVEEIEYGVVRRGVRGRMGLVVGKCGVGGNVKGEKERKSWGGGWVGGRGVVTCVFFFVFVMVSDTVGHAEVDVIVHNH